MLNRLRNFVEKKWPRTIPGRGQTCAMRNRYSQSLLLKMSFPANQNRQIPEIVCLVVTLPLRPQHSKP